MMDLPPIPAKLDYRSLAAHCEAPQNSSTRANIHKVQREAVDAILRTVNSACHDNIVYNAYHRFWEERQRQNPHETGLSLKELVRIAVPEAHQYFRMIENHADDRDADLFSASLYTDDERYMAGFEMKRQGSHFQFDHREVLSPLRGSGVGAAMLEAMESAVAAYADTHHAPATIRADCGQLDVLCFLYNQGYRPHDPFELQYILQEIDQGAIALDLAQYLYPTDTPDIEKTGSRSRFAYRITLEKVIENRR